MPHRKGTIRIRKPRGPKGTAEHRAWLERKGMTEKEYTRLRKYGLTTADFNKIWDRQWGECPICWRELKPEGLGGVTVDHDHATGIVRGLLCMNCNASLGWLEKYINTIAFYCPAYFTEAPPDDAR